MSQILKRLEKKTAQISAVQVDKMQVLALKADMENKLEEANFVLSQIEQFENEIQKYMEDKDVQLSVAKHTLIDGTEMNIFVICYDRTVVVSALGLIGKSKAHPSDEFNFELGYELALHRLMDKYLYILCNQE